MENEENNNNNEMITTDANEIVVNEGENNKIKIHLIHLLWGDFFVQTPEAGILSHRRQSLSCDRSIVFYSLRRRGAVG